MVDVKALVLIGFVAGLAAAGLWVGGYFSKLSSLQTEVEKPILQCILIQNTIDTQGRQQITMLYLNKGTVAATGISSVFSKDGEKQRLFVGVVPAASGINQYVQFTGSQDVINLPTKFETSLGNSESDSCNQTLPAPKAG